MTSLTISLFFSWCQPSRKKQTSKRPKVRIFSDKNIQKFVDELSTVNWNQVLNHNNGNQDCSEFYKYFNRIYCESFPLVQISIKRHKDKPWITKSILISIRHKNRLYKESILNPNDSNIHRYNMYKKILCDCLKRAEEVYYLNILNDRKNSAKNLWKHFGPILNNYKKRRGDISSLLVNGVKITEDKAIADTFNDFFSNVGRNLDQNIGGTDKNFRKYLSNRMNSSFFLAPILETDVRQELLKMHMKKACGPDNISPKINTVMYHCTHWTSIPHFQLVYQVIYFSRWFQNCQDHTIIQTTGEEYSGQLPSHKSSELLQ